MDTSGDASFEEVLQRAKRCATDTFAHGAIPFSQVVDSLNVVRSASFTPVYQVGCRALIVRSGDLDAGITACAR
jgi:hypothetical protein